MRITLHIYEVLEDIMEILLLIAVVVVFGMLYVTFREYLYNPSSRPKISIALPNEEDMDFNDPYKNLPSSPSLDREEKIRTGESGIIMGMLAKMASSDGDVCELEKELINNLIEDMTNHISSQMTTLPKEQIRNILENIFREAQSPNYLSTQKLATDFANLTKGEYKKRLKLVEFLFIIAYADNHLASEEREVILDVAAYLEISNEDFNQIYDSFEEYFSKQPENLELSKAYEILGVGSEIDAEKLQDTYKNLIHENRLNLFDHKILEVDALKKYALKLQEINLAYKTILENINSRGES